MRNTITTAMVNLAATYGKAGLVVSRIEEDVWHAEIVGTFNRTQKDPINNEVELTATGMTPADAMQALDFLLQRWW